MKDFLKYRSPSGRPSLFIFIITVAVIILLIFLNSRGWLNQPKNLFSQITSPIEKIFKKGGEGIYNFFKVFTSIKNLRIENIYLKEENQKLLSENTRLKEIERENQILRQQLNLASSWQLDLTSASVIGRNPENLGQYLQIDKGIKDGIRKNMPVISSQGALVGRIFESLNKTAFVLLITDPNSSVAALVQESRADGLIRGEYGLGLKMEKISQDQVADKENLVISSGLSGEFPKGLIIGQIEEVKQADNQVFQEAKVRPAADFQHLEYIFVITKY